MTSRGRHATDRLTRALLDLAARGERTHCSDPSSHHLWLSEHDNERAGAVMLCDQCPVLTVCRDTAEQRDERWGVWGGQGLQPQIRTCQAVKASRQGRRPVLSGLSY